MLNTDMTFGDSGLEQLLQKAAFGDSYMDLSVALKAHRSSATGTRDSRIDLGQTGPVCEGSGLRRPARRRLWRAVSEDSSQSFPQS